MTKDFQKVNEEVLRKWYKSAEIAGIPNEAYKPVVKIIEDKSRKSNYTFGAIFNSYRFSRPINPINCPLCKKVKEVSKDDKENISNDLKGYIVIPNAFPIVEGVSLSIDSRVGDNEKPMYTSKNLNGLAQELEKIFRFSEKKGFQAFHNSEGAGASIPNHEHWHLTNYGAIYELAGRVYSLENAVYESSKNNTKTIKDFPFSHLIFDQDNPERIVYFLEKIGEKIGNCYENGCVPHGIAQSGIGIFIVPFKNHRKKGIGSGETTGHIVCKNDEEFNNIDYNHCINKLDERLFKKGEINLESLL